MKRHAFVAVAVFSLLVGWFMGPILASGFFSGGGSQTWAQTLGFGATTSNHNPIVTTGDGVAFMSGTPSADTLSWNTDVYVARRGAAATLGISDGTTGCMLELFNTTGTNSGTPTNFEEFRATWVGNAVYVETNQGGAGASRDMHVGTEGAGQIFFRPNAVDRLRIDSGPNFVWNPTGSAVATNATQGFVFIETCLGTPTGVPAQLATGTAPLIIDATNNVLYFYSGGGWVKSSTGGAVTLGQAVNAGNVVNSVSASGQITYQSGGSYTSSLPEIKGPPDKGLFINAGTAAAAANGNDVSIAASNGGAGSTLGGNLTLSAGSGIGGGGGGQAILLGGSSGSSGGNGNQAVVQGGDAGTGSGGAGGTAKILGGSGDILNGNGGGAQVLGGPGNGTNQAGGTVLISMGASTGNATESILFRGPPTGGSGSGVNNPVTLMTLSNAGTLTFAAGGTINFGGSNTSGSAICGPTGNFGIQANSGASVIVFGDTNNTSLAGFVFETTGGSMGYGAFGSLTVSSAAFATPPSNGIGSLGPIGFLASAGGSVDVAFSRTSAAHASLGNGNPGDATGTLTVLGLATGTGGIQLNSAALYGWSNNDTAIGRLGADSFSFGNASSLSDVSGTLNFLTAVMGGKVTTYNGVVTAGDGAVVVRASGTFTGQTGAQTSIATFTPAADADLLVSAQVTLTSVTTASFQIQCTYTDAETNTARTLVLPVVQLAGTFITTGTITNVTGVGPYESPSLHIRAKAATAVTVKTAGTFTTVNYGGSAKIMQTGP